MKLLLLTVLTVLIVFTLISCNSMTDLANPENSFEGEFLPIGKAIAKNKGKEVQQLLTTTQLPIDAVGKGGKSGKPTFLMYAVLIQEADMVQLLLKNGADPTKMCLITNQMNEVDSKTGERIIYHEENPLNSAVTRIKTIKTAKKIANLLIDHGADVNGWGYYYYAPLAEIMLTHNDDALKTMLDFLLDKGANMNGYTDKSGWIPLMCASSSGNWHLVDYLLNKGADPRIINFSGWDFMWSVENVLERCPAEDKPDLEKLKNRLINEYGMQYPAVQNREKGRANRDVEYIKKGWRIVDNCVIIPESDAIEDALKGK